MGIEEPTHKSAYDAEKPKWTSAQKWARWSVMWTKVEPVVEAEPWFAALDAHRKAFTKEAVTEACLTLRSDYPGLLKPDYYLRRFARRYTPLAEHDAWVTRLERCVERVGASNG